MALNESADQSLIVHVGLDEMRMQRDITSMNRLIRTATNGWKADFTTLETSGRHFDALEAKTKGLTNTMNLTQEKLKSLKLQYDTLAKSEDASTGRLAALGNELNKTNRQFATQEKQLKAAQRQFEAEQNGLNKLNREYRLMEQQVSANARAQEMAGNKLTASRTKMLGLRSEVSKLNDVYRIEKSRLNDIQTEFGQNSQMYERQASKVIGLKSKMQEYNQTIADTSKRIGGMTARDTMNYDRLTRSSDRLINTGSKFKSVGQSMYGTTMSLGAGFLYSANQATKLENSYRMTSNLLVTGGERAAEATRNVTAMQRDGREYSLKYGKSMTDIASGYQELVKRGYSSQQALGAMKSMLQASAASGDDFNDVVKISTSTLESFGMRAHTTQGMVANTKKATNELAYAADMTATSFKDIGVAMQYAGPQAHAAGASLSETATMLGILSNNGLEAQVAGTGVRKVFNSLISPTKDAQKVLDKYNISIKDSHGKMLDMSTIFGEFNSKFKDLSKTQKVDLFHKMFGTTGQNAALILSQNADEIDKLNKKVAEAPKNNYIESLSAKNMQSAQNQLNILKQSATALGVEFAKEVLPSVTHITQALVPLIRGLSHVNQKTKDMTVAAIGIAAVAGPIVALTGNVISLVGGMEKLGAWYSRVNGRTRESIASSEANAKAIRDEAVATDELNAANSRSTGGVATSGKAGSIAEEAPQVGSRIERNAPGGIRGAWHSMGILDKAGIVAAGVDVGGSIWGAFSAKSKSQQGQAIWETSGKALGMAAGGLLGGPVGAMAGEQIGSAISKNITLKKVDRAITENNNRIAKQQKKDPLYNVRAQGGVLLGGDTNATLSAKQLDEQNRKPKNPLAGLSKAAQKETRAAAKELNGLYHTYRTLDSKQYQNAIRISDRQVKNANDASKKRIDLMLKEGLINKKTADSMMKQDEKYNKKKYGGLKDDLNKLNKLNDQYYKKGTISQKKYEQQKNKIINDMAKKEINALSKNSKEKEKIEKFFQKSKKSITDKEARDAIASAKKEYNGVVQNALRQRNKTVSAAQSQYKNVKKEADHQYRDLHSISKQQRDAIVTRAGEQRDKSQHAAEQQYKEVLKQAEKQKKDVISEIEDEVTGVESAHSSLANWYNRHNVFDKIIKDAAHATQSITGVAQGMATLEDGEAKAHAAGIRKRSKSIGRSADLRSQTSNPVFQNNAVGGPISKTQVALVGEQGPELAYNAKKGTSRLLGAKGAQLTKVFAGEHILTAKQTSKALNGGLGTTLKGYAGGTGLTVGALSAGNSDGPTSSKKKLDLKDSAKALKKFQKDSDKAWKKTDSDTNKHLKSQSKKVKNSYKDLVKHTDSSLRSLHRKSNTQWNHIYKDTNHYNNDIYRNTTKKQTGLKNSIASNTNKIYSTWKKDWNNVSGSFNNEFKKLSPYSKNGMNGAISSLNTGVGNINSLVSKFGGNQSILPSISHYAAGTFGSIANDEIAMVNDALGNKWKEIVQLPSGRMIEATEKNAVLPLPKGSRVFNGEQSEYLKRSGIVAHAKGTMSDDAMMKFVESQIKNPQRAWQNDFSDKVSTKLDTGLANSLAATGKGSAKLDGVPWYQALWTVIQEKMDVGSGSRGAFLKYAIEHYMGKPYKMGGNGPTYYDCSGMVAAALAHYGIDIGRTTTAMQKTTSRISLSEAKPGDLTIWGHGDGANGHVGIVMNRNGRMFNETPPKAGYGNLHDVSGIPWDGIFRIRQLHDEDPNQPKVSPKLKALVKKQLGSKALGWLSDNFAPEGLEVGGRYGGEYDPSLINKAAKAMHLGLSGSERSVIQAVIQHESGGKSSVVNNWDSNARAGHPSKGLLQFIDSTFAKYAMPGHRNINNPYDQLLAMFNDSSWRSDVHTGGWGPVGGRRYANGGIVRRHQIAEIAEGNLPEVVIPLDKSKRSRAFELFGKASAEMLAGENKSFGNNDLIDMKELLSNQQRQISLLKDMVQAIYATALNGKKIYEINKDESNKVNRLKNFGKGKI